MNQKILQMAKMNKDVCPDFAVVVAPIDQASSTIRSTKTLVLRLNVRARMYPLRTM